MELVAALPADLAAIADPATSGAAPLLRSNAASGDAVAAEAPFALFLELLTGALPPGEGLPAAGKTLPPDNTDLAVETTDATLAAACTAVPLPFLDVRGLPAPTDATSAAPPTTAPVAP